MREKLAIARSLRKSRKNFSNNKEFRKICKKCYWAYVVECIVKGNDERFGITFEGEYIGSIKERIFDWCQYVWDKIYQFYLITVTPNDDKTLRKYELIHYKVQKPVHMKVAFSPNEVVLYAFLEYNGFHVMNEQILSTSTIYEVARI